MSNQLSLSALTLLIGGCGPKATTPTAAPEQAAVEAPPPAPAPTSSATNAADIQWSPVYPDKPEGPMMALVDGNPKEGAFTAVVKLPAGHASPLHTHPATLQGYVLSGTVTNGRTADDAAAITAGSMWTQAGDEVHYTGCTEDADCIFVGRMEGAMGTTPAETAAEASTMTVTAAADIAYSPLNPEKPEGPGMLQTSGDMKAGPFTALVSFPAGATSPKHSHTATYSGVVVSGAVSHGGDAMTAGSYWTQIGGEVHTTGCSSEEACIFFVAMDGAMDMVPVVEDGGAPPEAPPEEPAIGPVE